VYCSNSTPFLEDGVIYGCDVETGALIAADMTDGTRLWQTTQPTNGSERRSRHATAFLIKHEDRFLLFNELGDLILAQLSREAYSELGRFHVLEPTNEAFGRKVVWSCPAFAEKCMFARNDKELVCVDLADRHSP
jgi:outer membrane protein assembly factor BamB